MLYTPIGRLVAGVSRPKAVRVQAIAQPPQLPRRPTGSGVPKRSPERSVEASAVVAPAPLADKGDAGRDAATAPPARCGDPPVQAAPSTAAPGLTPVEAELLKKVMTTASEAQKVYSNFSQEDVDHIFHEAAAAAGAARIPLAQMAAKETGMGVLEDKVIKNHFASEIVYNKYKNLKTCGVIEQDKEAGISKVAAPMGVVLGITPVTNPTSTAIFKALIAIKTRNAIVLCPHPRASVCTSTAVRIIHDAAVAAGAPPGLVQCISSPSLAMTQAAMRAPETALVLATGGPAMVHAAYSSGHPSLGVGAGNTPAVIDATADVELAVSSIMLSKTFDNGMICASEQAIVVEDAVYDEVHAELKRRGAHFIETPSDKDAARGVIVDKAGRLNAAIVGQPVRHLASLMGLKNVDKGARMLVAEIDEVGPQEPISREKLCPILAMYRAPDFNAAVQRASEILTYGGCGHTAVLYTAATNSRAIRQFSEVMTAVRVLVNTPASQGAIGDLYNFHLDPSLTLGCGSWGSTSVSSNVGPMNLLNIKHVTERRENMLWFRVPPKIFFKPGSLEPALKELSAGCKRAFIVSDAFLAKSGVVRNVTDLLHGMGLGSVSAFTNVLPDPTLSCIEEGLRAMRSVQPDIIIAVGGGSPMDAAKLMWLMYEQPDIEFSDVAARFMDIRKRINTLPSHLGSKASLVCVPTTSGTGSEVTPFAVVTDDTDPRNPRKYPLADYALTPSAAIIDSHLVMNMPRGLTAAGGLDALTHAIESYVSVYSTDYTKGMSLQAIKTIFKYLPAAIKEGEANPVAREKMHEAAAIAGMAFANAFLGVCHSMAHALGGSLHIPHGIANAALISYVIRYNATERPFKMAAFSQYSASWARSSYAHISEALCLTPRAASHDEKVVALIKAVEQLRADCGVPPTIREILQQQVAAAAKQGGGVSTDASTSVAAAAAADSEAYRALLPSLAERAFDDQCTGANPRYPLISELHAILQDAYETPVVELLEKSGNVLGEPTLGV